MITLQQMIKYQCRVLNSVYHLDWQQDQISNTDKLKCHLSSSSWTGNVNIQQNRENVVYATHITVMCY